jgi:hypothetical protein
LAATSAFARTKLGFLGAEMERQCAKPLRKLRRALAVFKAARCFDTIASASIFSKEVTTFCKYLLTDEMQWKYRRRL